LNQMTNVCAGLLVCFLSKGTVLVAVTIGGAFLSSCGPKAETQGPVKVLLPWQDISGEYSLQEIEIETLSDVYQAKGAAAEIYVTAKLSSNGPSSDKTRLNLSQTSEGLYIPADAISSQALAVYAHIERIAKLEEKIFGQKVVSYPRKVYVETAPAPGYRTNAAYFPELDIMMFLPFDLDGNLSLSFNGAVVAHEHAHAIFDKMVFGSVSEADSDDLHVRASSFNQLLAGVKWSKLLDFRFENFLKENFSNASEQSDDVAFAGFHEEIGEDIKDTNKSEQTDTEADERNADERNADERNADERNEDGTKADADDRKKGKSSGSEEKDITQYEARKFNSFFLAAVSEGQSDFFAWIYSQDTRFIERSLGDVLESKARDLGKPLDEYRPSSRNLFNIWLRAMKNGRSGGVGKMKYGLGTQLARYMISISGPFKPAERVTPFSVNTFSEDQERLTSALLYYKGLNLALKDPAVQAMRKGELISMNTVSKAIVTSEPGAQVKASIDRCRSTRAFLRSDDPDYFEPKCEDQP